MRFPGPSQATFAICRAIVWLASWMVPAAQRLEWRQSWTRQVWHWSQFLLETGQLTRNRKLELARFCWSAFPAAFWLRVEREAFLRRVERLRRAPSSCLAAIALALVLVVLVSGIIPAIASFAASAIPQPDRVCVINLNGKFRRVHSYTLLDLASAWKNSKLLESVAPYSWSAAKLSGPDRTVPILAARVAPEFFHVLELNAAMGRTLRAGDEETCQDCAVLSDEIWRLQFHRDPHVLGRHITLDGRPRTVIGVLPRNFHLLSPEIAVWELLDSGSPPFSNFVERIGAVARMRPGATESRVEADLADLTENAGYVLPASLLVVTSGAAELRGYFESYLLFALLAVLCAAAIVYARSGSGMGRGPLTLGDRFRWWAFFALKQALLLLLAGVIAWTLVRWLSIWMFGSIHPMANVSALWLFLVLSVAPLSWAIHDQQRRCRVCLRRLGTPVPIGAPGHVLLDWSGTEMVCPAGHGVLYLADSQANWLQPDRWDNLDDSWAGLFREQ